MFILQKVVSFDVLNKLYDMLNLWRLLHTHSVFVAVANFCFHSVYTQCPKLIHFTHLPSALYIILRNRNLAILSGNLSRFPSILFTFLIHQTRLSYRPYYIMLGNIISNLFNLYQMDAHRESCVPNESCTKNYGVYHARH